MGFEETHLQCSLHVLVGSVFPKICNHISAIVPRVPEVYRAVPLSGWAGATVVPWEINDGACVLLSVSSSHTVVLLGKTYSYGGQESVPGEAQSTAEPHLSLCVQAFHRSPNWIPVR